MLVWVFLLGCSPNIQYLGKSYTPTSDVDVFFDEKDIKREHEVMGTMKNEGSDLELDDMQSIQDAMIKTAKDKGADAVLFTNTFEKERGEVTDVTYGRRGDVATTSKETSNIVEAKLIKYTN